MIAPDHVRRLVLRELQVPVVWQGMIEHWPCRSWTPNELANVAGDVEVTFRIGTQESKQKGEVLWECDCSTVRATLGQFAEWNRNKTDGSSSGVHAMTPSVSDSRPAALTKLTPDKHWLYGDYMHMCNLFQGRTSLLEAVKWNTFGFQDRDGMQSTLWVGTRGAYTPCHYDTYGCNLVAQLSGRKRWYLFPPDDSDFMYPTRVPYEESSVYSSVCIFAPDLAAHPKFKKAHPYVVTLEPGQVLFVPMHWWHFVESLETSVSVNTWIELESDTFARVQEGLTRCLVTSIIEAAHDPDITQWINPSEDMGSLEESLRLLNTAIRHVREQQQPGGRAAAGAASPATQPPPAKLARSNVSIKSSCSTASTASTAAGRRRPYTKEERCTCCERRYEAVKPVPFKQYLDCVSAPPGGELPAAAAAAAASDRSGSEMESGAARPEGLSSSTSTRRERVLVPEADSSAALTAAAGNGPRNSLLTAEDLIHYATHPRVIAAIADLLLNGDVQTRT